MGAKPVLAISDHQLAQTANTSPHPQWRQGACLLAADLTTLSLVFVITVLGRQLLTPSFYLKSCLEMLPCLVMLLLAFAAKGLYPGALLHPAEEMRRVFVCISGVFLLMASSTFLWHNALSYSRSVFLVSWALGAPLVLITRYVIRRKLSSRHWWGIPAVVIGSGPPAQRVIRSLQNGMLGVKITGVFSDDTIHFWPEDLPPLLGGFSSISKRSRFRETPYCILALSGKTNLELRHLIQDHCKGFSHILLVPGMPGLCSLGISARELGGEVGFELPQRLFHTTAAIAKRTLDLTLALLVLPLAAPLFLFIIAAIKLTSRGPVFYGQVRLGKSGDTFKALKFRTMVQGADTVLANYLSQHPEHRLEWNRDHKLKDDPRVTKIGKWLRHYSLDELPQLLNVISGTMSLIGPRPIVHDEIEKYGRGYDLYTRVRPGLSGLWQVSGRNNTTYAERVAFDEYYVSNWSIWLDTYILIRTIKVVLTAEGAY